MLPKIDTDGFQTAHVLLNDIFRRGLQNYLKLHVLIEAVGIVAITAIGRASAGLHIGGAIRFRSQHPQKSFRTHSAGAYFHVVRFLNYAAALAPILLEAHHVFLKSRCFHGREGWSGCGFKQRQRDQFPFNMRFDLLREEAAQSGAGRLPPDSGGQLADGSAQNLIRHLA